MKVSQAAELVSVLLAAFPHPKVERATVEVYVEQVSRLRSYEAGREAVDACVRGCRMLPRISEVLDEYDRVKDRYAPPALREPPMSEEQRKENLGQAYALLKGLEGSIGRSMP